MYQTEATCPHNGGREIERILDYNMQWERELDRKRDKLRGKDKIQITETAALSLEIVYSETENMFCSKCKL